MNSRERLNRMLDRKDHDRIPRHDAYWAETVNRWTAEGLEGSPFEALQSDVAMVGHLSPVPFPGRDELVHEDAETRSVIGEYGETLRWWKERTGTPEHVGTDCTSPDIWREKYRPLLVSGEALAKLDFDALRREYASARARDKWIPIGSRQIFCYMQTMVGDVTLLMALAEEPEWVEDMANVIGDAFIAMLDRVYDAGIHADGLWLYDDMAFTKAPFMSPGMYRELIWPQHKRAADWAHAHGMKCIMHTDGNISSLIGHYMEAGIDCLQPLEAKAGLDVRALAPQHGGALSFFGNIDAIVLSTNDREKIEEEVTTKLRAGMKNHGYAYHSDHSVPPTVSWESYRFVIDLLNRLGNYS